MALRDTSLLSHFDELCRGFNLWMNGDPLREFQSFAHNQEECRKKWISSEELCSSVLKELNDAREKKEKLELQVKHVTEMLKNEIQIRQRVQREERELERKLRLVKSIVSNDNNIAEETRDKLVSITSSSESGSRWDSESPANYLIDTTSDEIESSTRSILSSLDVTVDKTDEDMELSYVRSVRTGHRLINDVRKKQSVDFNVRGRKKLSQDGPKPFQAPQPTMDFNKPNVPQTSSSCNSNQIAVCVQETNETAEELQRNPKALHLPNSASSHFFATKVILKQEVCISCKNRIRFGKSAMKCVHCLLPCHVECCAESLTMPSCIPTVRAVPHCLNLADYSPKNSPMIPTLLVLCVEEVESRGLEEIGIYRVQAEEREVHALKEKIFSGKVKRNQLTSFDIHIVAGVVRSFLLSLKNPIVTYALRESFIKISYIQHEADVQTAVCELVPQLPQSNRDTLAYLMIHLQKIAESKNAQMSKTQLAKYFAPLFIGNPQNPIEDGLKKLRDLKEQQMAMEKLLLISSDYWSCFVKQAGVILDTPTANANRNKKKSGFFTSPHY